MNFFKKMLLKNALKNHKMADTISVELKKQLAGSGMSEAMVEKFIEGMKKNPDLFTKMAEEGEKAKKEGRSEQEAIMKLVAENQDEFKKIFQ